MNKKFILKLVLVSMLSFVFSFSVLSVTKAYASTAPVVSIGVGNGNTPENTGPTHLGTYHGDIPVFATVADDDLENYHFRVVKEGGVMGDTCSLSGSLFASENQGYASTTLGKTACGFNF